MLTSLALKVYKDRSVVLFEQYKRALEQWGKTVDPKMLKAINVQRRLKGKSHVRGSHAARLQPRVTPFTWCVAVVDLDRTPLTACTCPHAVSFGIRRIRWSTLQT